MSNIFKTLYVDYLKPIDKYILTLVIAIIFVVAGYWGYGWFVQPTIENLGTTDLANDNTRISDAEILFFYAEWCPHCKTAKPGWDNFAKNFDSKTMGFNKIKCTSVDCTEGDSPLIQEYSVDGYPTVILKKDGENNAYDGKITEDNLKNFVTEFLENK